MLRKILFNNIPATYTIGAVVGVLIGFLLLMLTLNAWNLYTAFTGSTQGQSEQYVTINKKVGLLNSLNSSFSSFKQAEIDNIQQQPFLDDWAPYLRSTFGVQASRQASANMPYMRTEMFFEALPNRFLDHKPEDFTWGKGQTHIPIIIPKEYLNLYNFGFAKAQGLPNVSEKLVGRFSFDIRLSDRQRKEQYTGSVAGFTNRVQSLLVPYAFLKSANSRFSNSETQKPDRLILKIKPNMEKDLYRYLEKKGFETTHDAFQGGRVALFVNISGTVLLAIASLIILLALIIYALTLQLTVQRNKDEIYQLILLGYSHRTIFFVYTVLQSVIALFVFALSAFLVYLLTGEAIDFLAQRYINLENFSIVPGVMTSALVMVGFLVFLAANTYRLVRRLSLRGTI
jgi:hypothetical protein